MGRYTSVQAEIRKCNSDIIATFLFLETWS